MAKSLPLTENFYQKRKKTLATHHSIFDFGARARANGRRGRRDHPFNRYPHVSRVAAHLIISSNRGCL